MNHSAETAISKALGRLMRQALLAIIIAACGLVAIYHATIAGTLALDAQYGLLNARLIVAAIYAAIALISLAIFWQHHRAVRLTANGKTLASPRELQVVMLIEAAMLGYQFARKDNRRR